MVTTNNNLTPSSRANPCPICGRTEDGDCRIGPELVLCHRGASHHPPEWAQKPGDHGRGQDGQEWAYLGDAADGRTAQFRPDRPRTSSNGNGARRVVAAPMSATPPAPAGDPIRLLRLLNGPDPLGDPIQAAYSYGPGLRVLRVQKLNGSKDPRPQHLVGEVWERGAGPDPWPLFRQADALAAAKATPGCWVLEVEGEKCVLIARQGGIAAITHPGHAHRVEQIRARYEVLRKAGVEGIVFLTDHDDEGRKRAEQSRQAAVGAGLRFLLLEAAAVWDGLPQGGSIDDAPGTPAERVQAIEQAIAEGLGVEDEARPGLDGPATPFRVLGWDESRKAVNYQFRGTAQLGQITVPCSQGNLLSLAPLGFWTERFPATTEGRGIDLLAASDSLLRQADAAGVFNERSLRGRGAWPEGGEVVYHLGDRLWVGGRVIPLGEHQGEFLYRLRDPLPFADRIENLEPLTDAEGMDVLTVIRNTGWRGEHDGLHIAGWLAIATVSGALRKRPQLQVSCPKGSGKTDWIDSTAKPLLAGVALSVVNPSEAGLRQSLGGDSLPVLVDESEAEDQRKREGHLQVARYAFDGSSVPRGTTSGRALTFALCSSVALIGINAPILNPADRSRFIQVARRRLPLEEWQAFSALRPQFINTEVGVRLLLRMLTHFGTLQRNIAALAPVIARRVGGETDSRNGEVYGTVLAGARLLQSTVPLDEAAAARWLDEIGWTPMGEGGAETAAEEESEAQQCLEHLLGYRVRWKDDATGEITVRELLEKARTGSSEAEHALARLGVKADPLGRLVVSNKSDAFSGTKWRDGAHRERLREIPGAEAAGSQRFAGGKVDRCTVLPCDCLDPGLGF